ncbi:LOW QUALITY PROTEIN: ionotropic receptor 21a-like [Eupeodes corollae]|uniref:LOW QUALITY PROTEIN: ionotropic receptor 21a-like n=1 Tax=Eupeodes corollae TaxID=290404 RepID=UPI0024932B6A|nr:LOW QUALITY PROTEIN: ionotropic receptor 21a-like [Eupeodes corollae]
MISIPNSYISVLINFIVQTYHYDATSLCVVFNENFPFTLHQTEADNYVAIRSLYRPTLNETKKIPFDQLDVLSKFEGKLVESIEYTHCESFIAFEEEIMIFVGSFMKSVLHSKWRSLKNRFLFVYTEGRFDENSAEFDQPFFQDLTNILLIEISKNGTVFDLKTTKFVGSRKNHPEELVFLDRYYGKTNTFEFNNNLYPDKVRDLQGRELISAVFPYEPFAILRNATEKNHFIDVKDGNEDPSKSHLYDGTDAQILFQLCRLYNCTIQVDTSEEEEWGFVYENYTADGVLGLVFNRKADIGMMAMYMWYDNYLHLDMSSVLSRSGVTCLVPKPRRVISWLLPLEPFHWLLWIGIVGCLILETIGLLVTYWADKTENPTLSDSARFGYVTSLKLFVSQGSDYLPSSVSVRIVLFSCYMIDIIITSIYSGGLASILTIPTLEEVADSVERLAKFKLIWTATAYNWILTINGSDMELMNKVLENFRVYTAEEIKSNREIAKSVGFVIERLDFGHFAIPDHLDQEIIDDRKLMVDDIYYQYCVAFVPRSWALLEKFNDVILMMHSSGLTQYLEWKVTADHMNENLQKQIESSARPSSDGVGPVKLGMENFAGIIIILIVGIFISTMAFVGEIVHFRYYNKQNIISL